MNQLQTWLMPENVVLTGTISGLALLICSLIKHNLICNRIAVILLLISSISMYPMILDQELCGNIPFIGYKQAFYLLSGGAVLVLMAENHKAKDKPAIMAISILGTLSVLLAFNIIGFGIEQWKPELADLNLQKTSV